MPAEPHRSGRADERDRPDQRGRHDTLTESDVYHRRPGWPKLLALAVGLLYAAITVTSVISLGATAVGPLGHLHLVADFGVSWFLLAAHGGTAVWGLLAPIRRSATKVFGVALFMAYLGLSAYSIPAVIAEGTYLNVGWGNAIVYVVTSTAGLAIAIGASAGKPFPQEPPPESDEVM